MGQAVATFTPNDYPNGIENALDVVHIRGSITITANPDTYAANGLPISPSGPTPYSGQTPITAYFHGTSGYQYYYDPVNKTIRAYSGGTEVGTGAAIPAAVSGDTIYAEFVLRRS